MRSLVYPDRRMLGRLVYRDRPVLSWLVCLDRRMLGRLACRDRRLLGWLVRPDRRLLGWLVVGLGASILELGVLRALHEGLALALPIATALAAEMLIVLKFGVTDRWVFGHPWPTLQRALRYHGACAGALVVYWLVMNIASVALGVPYVLGFLIGTGAAFAWSLVTNFLWVWAR